jgi:LruC domain-containing protein
MKYFKTIYIGLLLIALSFQAEAEPFNSCPSRAFLIQDSVAQMYGVNLVTGDYNLLSSDLGTSDKINGVGFNFHDNYIYGWGYEWGALVRIGNDFQASPLPVSNKPDINFYVGDVGLNENAYYMYRSGSSFGLYKISLDESDVDYLVAKRIIDGASLSLAIFDLAFHPTNGFAYSVDKNGSLLRINVIDGSSNSLGNVGESGTFGAVYFDVNGNFYISRNQDGQIFRIDISAVAPTAELFAYGPSSSNNDGARCAIAPIVDDTEPPTTDFGDAPDSYRTSLNNNGARHGVSDIYLGNTVDAEYDAYVYPLSDESTANDEDGVNFISGFEAGLDSLLQVTANGSGYLNIWVDWDQNGQFDADEQLVYDRAMTTGTETFLAETPFDAVPGTTWARVRYSSTLGVSATGGVADGEVEDYQVLVFNPGYSLVRNNPYFLAFEDKWPEKGDYDFNDVVIRLDSSLIVSSDNLVKQLKLEGELKAMGASYRNGFAIQLQGVTNSDIDQAMIRFDINGQASSAALLEEGTAQTVLKISDDLRAQVKPDTSCWYYKTEPGCSSSTTFRFSVTIPFTTGVAANIFPNAPFNPFIFATPGTDHGSMFLENPGRGLEIHLKNKPPTSLVNNAYFGLSDDASDPDASFYYQTGNGLPWGLAINIGESENWFHPYEWVNILRAYPQFEAYATSNGAVNPAWFQNNNADSAKTYRY